MTENATFKRLVRERMARTGERYTTARMHLLARHEPTVPAGLLPGWRRTGGIQPDLAATANALAHVGVAGPTGEPLDEIDTLGLSGGIGFMYAVFVYEGHGPTLTLTTRTDSMPDATVAQVLGRAGVEHHAQDTRSEAKAARSLVDALDEEHPVLVSLDESQLPMHAPEGPVVAGMPRVVGVIGRDGDDWLVDDQDPDPVRVRAASLTAARAGLPRSTNHLVVVAGVAADHDPVAASMDALRRTVDGYDEPPARPFASNVGTAGLRTWASALTGADKRSWGRLFEDPEHRRAALRRTASWIESDLTAPGASRGLWATWVDRVAEVTGRSALRDIADAARASEQRWIVLAETAGAAAETDAAPTAVFTDLADRVTGIADAERSMLDDLAVAIDG